jgi:hypothetical protein
MKKLHVVLLIITMICTTTLITGKTKVTPYGFVKLDAIYETGSSHPGNFVLWAKNPGESDGLFHLTANQTRLGLNIEGISFGDFKVKGKVEIDFYGGNAENKAYNFMRKAFLEISNGSLSILAGQSSDIISPLVPSDLNYTVHWGSGNIGYRRPQLSFKYSKESGKGIFTIQGGVFRTIGNGLNGGIALGVPTFQGRIAGKFLMGNSSLQLGVSGHYGKSKESSDLEYATNSLNLDVVFEVSPKVKILGEYFTGKNLGTFFGGIAQSVNSSGTEIRAKGFYVNLQAKTTKKSQLSVAYGMDDPDDSDLNDGNRSKNSAFFVNYTFNLSPSLKIGFQVANWQTDYLNGETQKTTRIQNSWILVI